MNTLIYLSALLCIPFPSAPSGFACIPEHHWFLINEEIPLAKLDHPLYTYRNIEVKHFQFQTEKEKQRIMSNQRKINMGRKDQ